MELCLERLRQKEYPLDLRREITLFTTFESSDPVGPAWGARQIHPVFFWNLLTTYLKISDSGNFGNVVYIYITNGNSFTQWYNYQ